MGDVFVPLNYSDMCTWVGALLGIWTTTCCHWDCVVVVNVQGWRCVKGREIALDIDYMGLRLLTYLTWKSSL